MFRAVLLPPRETGMMWSYSKFSQQPQRTSLVLKKRKIGHASGVPILLRLEGEQGPGQ